MKKFLEELKNRNYIKGVKVEFETEVVSNAELQYLSDMLKDLEIGLTIKLGGATSIFDIKKAREFGAKTIVAPMVESAYTVKKFV